MIWNLRRITAGLAAACALLGAGAQTAEAIPLLNGFGGPSGYGLASNCLQANDDGYSASINITPAFPMGLNFFGMNHRQMFVNTNGNITFRTGLGTYTPQAFPVANQPMIAPWWGDVDTRGGNPPTNNNICFHIEPNRVVVTWNNVGYFASHHNFLNDFQLILTSSNTCSSTGDFDVEFRYNRCEWTTGDASGGTNGRGGTPAQVGFDAGNRMNYVALPASRTAAILDVCRTTNVPGGQPGLYRFQIRGGVLGGGCTGAGMPCQVPGQMGLCGQGITVCEGMGTACRQQNMPGPRRCNGYDNDCDGMVDDSDDLCPLNQICDRGSCVDRCQGELGCLTGRTCNDRGACVETACLMVNCPTGQRCSGGQCVGICDGFSCPNGRFCVGGRCVDPCAGVRCGEREVCQPDPARGNLGRCVPSCQCTPCGPGQTCQPDGFCVPDACVGVTCPTGTYCSEGRCRDACESGPDSRLCPSGEICQMGECTPGREPPRDAGTMPGNDGSTTTDSGSTVPRDVPRADGGPRVDAGVDSGLFFTPGDRAGCACSTGPTRGADGRLLALGAALGAVLVTRRRRRQGR